MPIWWDALQSARSETLGSLHDRELTATISCRIFCRRNMLVVDMYNKAQKLGIEQAERVVYVIGICEDKKDSTAGALENLLQTKMRDYMTEVDEQSIVPIMMFVT